MQFRNSVESAKESFPARKRSPQSGKRLKTSLIANCMTRLPAYQFSPKAAAKGVTPAALSFLTTASRPARVAGGSSLSLSKTSLS